MSLTPDRPPPTERSEAEFRRREERVALFVIAGVLAAVFLGFLVLIVAITVDWH